MRKIIPVMLILIPALSASAELLTAREIESALRSKKSYAKAEVVIIIRDILRVVEDEITAAQKEVEAAHQKAVDACRMKIADAQTESTVIWIGLGIVGGGLVVYGIYRADPAIITTGSVMITCVAARIVIAIK